MEPTTTASQVEPEVAIAEVKTSTEPAAAPGQKAKRAKVAQNAKVKSKKASKRVANSDSSEEESENEVKTLPAKGKSKANFLTPARIAELTKTLESLKSESNQSLKDMLRKNNQSMSGNKTELLGKVADGKMFGRIPKCSTCHGGRLAFDLSTGEYRCNGYYEDQAFYQCSAVFQFSQITRDKW